MHSWSRLWTGATHDVVAALVHENLAADQKPSEAIKNAQAAQHEGDFTYRDMANAWIASQEQNDGGKHVDTERKILPEASFSPEAPLPPGTNDLSLELKGERFGQFQGARVSTTLSGQSRSLDQDPETSARLENDMARLIRTGKILWTEPNQTVSRKDLFDKSGEPYLGLIRWTDGAPTIERVTIAG